MTPEMICKVDGQGNLKEANGPLETFIRIKMHLKVYQQRPDVNAVVHAHPPIATSFAIAGIPLDKLIMPEAIIFLVQCQSHNTVHRQQWKFLNHLNHIFKIMMQFYLQTTVHFHSVVT